MTQFSPIASSSPAEAQTHHKGSTQDWPPLGGPGLWALLVFIAALFGFRVWEVEYTGISLFFDEAQYWDWSEHLAWGYFSKPPLIAGLIWLSTALFGDSVLGVKLLSMLLYPATALALVGFARALWPTNGGLRTGIVAALVFMSIPMVGMLGLFATTDAPLILCWTLASWMLWRAQVSNRLSYWALTGLACGVGLMGKYTMAAFALTAIWALWGVPGPKQGVARLGPWLAALIALALLGPNLWWNAQNDYPTLAHTAELTTESNRSGGIMPTITFLLGQVLMLGPIPVIAAIWLTWRPKAPQSAPLSGPDAHLASVSSYRFLWAMSLPLQAIAVVQAFYADAHVNWAAPSMIGFTLLTASTLSAPLAPLSAARPTRWLMAVVLSNLVLTAVALHLRDIVGPTLPSKQDVLVRMRGWQAAFDQIAPVLDEPSLKGLPMVTDQRLLITEAAYELRAAKLRTYAWNPQGLRQDHYQMTRSLPNQVGMDVLLLSSDPQPSAITSRFASARELKSVLQPVGPDRHIELHLFLLRGFQGYGLPTSPVRPSGTDQPADAASHAR